ncbi:DUF3570 domain-containing protein [Enhygromyxa salina]|uniref:DUF3570 domain-containing protein n=1 Tax=Enhygromyxa salina TaxID=215803 RepID=UPI0011BACD68|nr:DUF3570 domain-containing protein [Enhygromyxa salina]
MSDVSSARARSGLSLARVGPALVVALTLLVSLGLPVTRARAEDRVTVRGNYYRETSTRVLQPMVTFRKELPDERFALETEYLLDVISSASIGAGSVELGGDKVFTEARHEATFRATTKIDDWGAAASYRYSTETDYQSNNFGVALSREFLQRTANVSLSYSATFDRVYKIVSAFGSRDPWTSSGTSNLLQVHYLNLGYSHVLHKQVVGGVNLEGIYAKGPQDNPYRRTRDAMTEQHPLLRKRLAPALWLRAHVPQAKMTLEPHYRFYADDWGITAHSADARVHFRAHRDLALRLRYRYYTQTQAKFWRDGGAYADTDPFRTDDPKMDDFRSNTVGLELTWHLDSVAKLQGLGWLDGAWIQANYNHVFVRCDDQSPTCMDQDFGYGTVRSTRYGDNRYGNLAFSIAF